MSVGSVAEDRFLNGAGSHAQTFGNVHARLQVLNRAGIVVLAQEFHACVPENLNIVSRARFDVEQILLESGIVLLPGLPRRLRLVALEECVAYSFSVPEIPLCGGVRNVDIVWRRLVSN